MRYYNIKITPPAGAASAPIIFTTRSSDTSTALTGYDNGSALQIELDILQNWFHQASQNGLLRIYGVNFNDITQRSDFNPVDNKYWKIQLSVGMSKGLPYANPKQAGLIIDGSILQAFGNWQGNQVTLDLVISPSSYDPNAEVNLSFSWKKGDTLEAAIRQAIDNEKSYKGIPIYGSLDPNLIFTEDQPAIYYNLLSLSKYVNGISKQIIKDKKYIGASIAATSAGFLLYDGSKKAKKAKTIEYQDIIGNLTWIGTSLMQAKLVMRSDLDVGDLITFPSEFPLVNQAGFSQVRKKIAFEGNFEINQIRHVGASRQPDANSWVTIVDCIAQGRIV